MIGKNMQLLECIGTSIVTLMKIWKKPDIITIVRLFLFLIWVHYIMIIIWLIYEFLELWILMAIVWLIMTNWENWLICGWLQFIRMEGLLKFGLVSKHFSFLSLFWNFGGCTAGLLYKEMKVIFWGRRSRYRQTSNCSKASTDFWGAWRHFICSWNQFCKKLHH